MNQIFDRPTLRLASFALLASAAVPGARAAVSYTVPGSTYSENFDGLPKDAPSNANIEPTYANGWTDDTTTLAATRVSVPGWYLYHTLSPAENGANDHQRLRFGPGANTGSFWAFGATAGATDMALGDVGSATIAANGENVYVALRLTNNTGGLLDSITITYDGEQWRDGQDTIGETLSFGYSGSATAADWFSTATFTGVPTLSFTSPVIASTSTGGAAVDGNTAGRIANITANITGISWPDGTDLWLRWADPQLTGLADDGLAIDNVRVSATSSIPEPAASGLFGLSLAGLLLRRRRGRA